MNWAGAAGSARGMSQDTIRLRPESDRSQLGLRDEFTTGWNEVSGRAANYITDSNGVLETDPRVGNSAFHAEQRDASVRAARRAGLGSVRQRQDRDSRGLRHLLFADRRSQLSC